MISGERSRVIQTRMAKAGNTGRQTREKRELSHRMRRKGKGRQNTDIWRVPLKGRTQAPPFMRTILFNLKGKTKRPILLLQTAPNVLLFETPSS